MSCTIRKMELQEIEIAMYLAYKEGWNPGLNDGITFYNTDPDGFFIAEIDNRVVGCISAVRYSNDYGFIGFFVVDNDFRSSSAGTQLARAALKYLNGLNIGIDGVEDRIKNYERLGFTLAYKNIRFEGIGGRYQINDRVFPISKLDFRELLSYDKRCFPVPRPAFLKNWINMPKSYGCGYFDEGICGYGMIRPCRKGFKIGPLFADRFSIANDIFKALSNYAVDELIYLDVPQVNPFAEELAKKYDMKPIFKTARMYSKEEPLIDINKIFGVTSFELG